MTSPTEAEISELVKLLKEECTCADCAARRILAAGYRLPAAPQMPNDIAPDVCERLRRLPTEEEIAIAICRGFRQSEEDPCACDADGKCSTCRMEARAVLALIKEKQK